MSLMCSLRCLLFQTVVYGINFHFDSIVLIIFTARCTMSVRLQMSVRLSVMLRYRGHMKAM